MNQTQGMTFILPIFSLTTADAMFCYLKHNPETLIAIVSLFLLFFYCIHRRKHTLTNWPIAGMLPGILSDIHRVHDLATNVLESSGCTFLFKGPWFLNMDMLFTCDPANVNHIFNANFANFPKGEEFLDIFDVLGGGIFNADNESWKAQRRMVHSQLSHPKFRQFVAESAVSKVNSAVVPLLERAAEMGSVLDFQDVFLRFTFDATCTLVMGVDPCCLSPEMPVVPFAKAMDDAMEVLLLRHVIPKPLWKAMRWLGVGPEKKMIESCKAIDKFVEKHVSRKRDELSDETRQLTNVPDMLGSILSEKNDVNNTKLPFDPKSSIFLRDMAVSLMLAGRDTTAMGLSWFFWLLSNNPHVEAKILDEIKTAYNVGDDVVTDTQALGCLVYLHAALCETLRLYPPVPSEHKGVLKPDVMPSGHLVGPHMQVFVSLYAMGRMEGVWGKDCREFRPERWISENGKIKHEPSYKFMSFNSGPRTCLGKDVAFTQMKVVVVSILTKFKVHVLEGQQVVPKPSIILHMKNGMKVRVENRDGF